MTVWNNTVKKRFEYEALSSKEAPIAQDVDGSRHICNICEFSYATKEILKVHTKKHNHENDTSVINATTRETKVES